MNSRAILRKEEELDVLIGRNYTYGLVVFGENDLASGFSDLSPKLRKPKSFAPNQPTSWIQPLLN